VLFFFEHRVESINAFFSQYPDRATHCLALMQATVSQRGLPTPAHSPATNLDQAIDWHGTSAGHGQILVSNGTHHGIEGRAGTNAATDTDELKETERRSHAKDSIRLAIQNIGSPETLMDLRCCLLAARVRSSGAAYCPVESVYRYNDLQGAEELAQHLKELQRYLRRSSSSTRLAKAEQRFHLARVAQLYLQYQQNRKNLLPGFRGSLAVLFANVFLEDELQTRSKTNKAANVPKSRQIQKRWDRFMAIAKPWHLFVRAYGPGVLLLIPNSVQNEE
jgi:hypothetical protein